MSTIWRAALAVATTVFLYACANTAPQVSEDGLELQPDTRFQDVYLRPGAELTGYSSIALSNCDVSFRKNWLRDQNNNRVDVSRRVSEKDVEKVQASLSALCDEYFTAALSEAPAYAMAESGGPGVLLVEPHIVNLDIAAPDTMSPGMSRTYTTSSGEMTLQLELRDGGSGEVLARIIDRRRGMDTGRLQWTNGVTNRADASRALKRWALLMREGLDKATGR